MDGVEAIFSAMFDHGVKVKLHDIYLPVHEPVPPFGIGCFEIKVWLNRVVHRIGEASKTLDHIKRIPDTAEDFVTGEGKDHRHEARVMSFDDPHSVVNYEFTFQPLDLQSSGGVELNSGASRDSSQVL